MKKKWNIAITLTACASLLFAVGCETSDNPRTDGVETYFEDNPVDPAHISGEFNVSLKIQADSTQLASPGQKAVLKAVGGTPPFNWVVDNAGLGNVSPASGESVVYTRSAIAGHNAVSAVDARGQVARIVIVSN